MADQLSKLPVEILFIILSYVPIPALLSFGATSKSNYVFHTHCMRKLHLAIFHKRVHATVAFLSTGMQHDPKTAKGQRTSDSHRVRVVLPPATRYTSPEVCKLPMRISNQYYTVTKYAALKHTSRKRCSIVSSDDVGFVHSISTERTIRAQNKAFADIVNRYGHSLDELELLAYNLNEEGAMAIDREDERDSSERKIQGASLNVLWVENCDGIRTNKSIDNMEGGKSTDIGLDWIHNLKSLESLSLRECRNIDAEVVAEANKLLWHIPELYLPRSTGPNRELPPPIEVDPLYL
uniref:F-box domain-containing protein n=1 Tax=Talaromyces marneffei PM1 TaxID=1077442 RepID=A0A093UR71_TALMA